MYRDGLGVKEDIDQAVAYFQSAANAELADAHVNLGRYYMGQSVITILSCTRRFPETPTHPDL